MDKFKSTAGYILIILVVLLITNAKTSGAWFVSEEEFYPIINQSAEVTFIVDGGIRTDTSSNPYVPGDNLLRYRQSPLIDENRTLRLINGSTITTDLRFRIYYDIYTGSELLGQVPYIPCSAMPTNPYLEAPVGCDPYFLVVPASGWRLADLGAAEDANYFYYDSITPSILHIEVIAKLCYNAFMVDNDNMNQTLGITIVVQAKQSLFVGWSDLGIIN